MCGSERQRLTAARRWLRMQPCARVNCTGAALRGRHEASVGDQAQIDREHVGLAVLDVGLRVGENAVAHRTFRYRVPVDVERTDAATEQALDAQDTESQVEIRLGTDEVTEADRLLREAAVVLEATEAVTGEFDGARCESGRAERRREHHER